MAPMMVMTSATTAAKIGRAMKKWLNRMAPRPQCRNADTVMPGLASNRHPRRSDAKPQASSRSDPGPWEVRLVRRGAGEPRLRLGFRDDGWRRRHEPRPYVPSLNEATHPR